MMSPIAVLLALLLALPGIAQAQEADVETRAVERQVLQKASWLAEARACPASAMPKPEILLGVAKNKCTSGKRALCLKKCSAGNASACYWLANELQDNKGSPLAVDALFQRSCKLGIMSGCTNRGARILNHGRNDPAAEKCAAQTFSIACASDDPWGCSMYGLLLSRGTGVPKNDDLALEVLGKSCKYGADDPACSGAMGLKATILKARDSATRK
jgi:hypothetical protein